MTKAVSGDALTALAAKWRAQSEKDSIHGDPYRIGRGWGLAECADELDHLIAAGRSAATTEPDKEPPAKVKHAVFLYLNTLVITSDNIGDIRRSLFMPFDCKWNGWVRDMTAELENKSSAPAPLPAPTAAEEPR